MSLVHRRRFVTSTKKRSETMERGHQRKNRASSAPNGSLQLLRTVAELLSSDTPVVELWPDFSEAVAALLSADRVVVVMRDVRGDRIEFDSRAPAIAPDDHVGEDYLATDVLERGETIARSHDDGVSVGAPIRFASTVLGAIVLHGVNADLGLIPLLESCALYLGARIHNDGAQHYAKLALIDGLTGIANRRKFDESLEAEWARARRDGTSLALVMVDIDYFKSFNDHYGHQAGDLFLQQVAHARASSMQRPADLFARYGGEEFVALLPATDVAGAAEIAERLRTALIQLNIAHRQSSLGIVTLSAGVAACHATDDLTPSDLLAKADAALYDAKIAGRNRVMTSDYVSPAQPAERAVHPLRNNLPIPLAPLVGRVGELSELRALIALNRLVTIVGVGGIGKTRLALRIASEVGDTYPDGAWFVDLGGITDPSMITRLIAAVFGDGALSSIVAGDELARLLATKRALIVIDNCEHLLTATARVVAALVRGCPALRIVATSREPLGIVGEARYRLPLLSLPPPDARLSARSALRADSVVLFCERARAVRPDFVLDDANAPLVATIVRRLDGIALAIELAAARVEGTALETLAARLDQRFRLLTAGDPSALPRQRTMRATLDWSFDLLSESEQTLLRRLAVFAGVFSLEAAESICAVESLSAVDVADLQASLVRKSLVVDENGDGSSFSLLESVRVYAREKLTVAGEADAIARRHAVYYADLADRMVDAYPTISTREWLALADRHRPNYRAAIEWSLGARNDIVLGARLAAALLAMLSDRGADEGIHWVEEALALLEPGLRPSIEAHLYLRLANCGTALRSERLREVCERAVAMYRTLDEPVRFANAVRLLAQVLYWYYPREREEARRFGVEALELARASGDQVSIAFALNTSALMLDLSDIEGKRGLMEEALALSRRFGNDEQIGLVLTWMSEVEFAAGEDVVRALGYGRAALRCAESSGSRMRLEISAANLAIYAAGAGEWHMAIAAASRALRLSRESRTAAGITWAIQGLACAAAGLEEYALAARLLAFCDARCGKLHSPRQADQGEDVSARRLRAKLAAALSASDLSRELQAGSELSEDAAVAQALAIDR
jgi:diguanylate cyclase (GGDEF)-like protein